MTADTVRITVEAARSPAGRLTGSVITASGDARTFSGTLELLASIEAALDTERPHHSPTP